MKTHKTPLPAATHSCRSRSHPGVCRRSPLPACFYSPCHRFMFLSALTVSASLCRGDSVVRESCHLTYAHLMAEWQVWGELQPHTSLWLDRFCRFSAPGSFKPNCTTIIKFIVNSIMHWSFLLMMMSQISCFHNTPLHQGGHAPNGAKSFLLASDTRITLNCDSCKVTVGTKDLKFGISTNTQEPAAAPP